MAEETNLSEDRKEDELKVYSTIAGAHVVVFFMVALLLIADRADRESVTLIDTALSITFAFIASIMAGLFWPLIWLLVLAVFLLGPFLVPSDGLSHLISDFLQGFLTGP